MKGLRGVAALGVAVCVVADYSLVGHAAPTWSVIAGRMSDARELPEAVVLQDGRVLVISGIRLGALSTAVDVYNPVTNMWATPAASLHTGRYLFAAAVLRDGRVLVTGGLTVVTVDDVPTATLLASTEIYDPAHDTWTPGPDLPFPTVAPRAVTLGDGRVLVIGGLTSDGLTSSTALFDPAIAAWTSGAPMSYARLLPDATPLADGRILVTGGFTNDDRQSSVAFAELFDPSTSSWSPAGQMSIGHTLGIATRLQDGRVLVAGGADSNLNPALLANTDIYEPITNTWHPANPMSIGRVFFAGGLLADGSVIVAGGLGPDYGLLQTAELYDSQHDRWAQTIQSLSAPRAAMAGAVVGDGRRFLVAGGLANRDVFQMFDTGEVYTLNRPPVAIASSVPPVTEGVPGSLAAVMLSAAGSSDPDNDALTFTWTEGTSTLASTVDPTRTSTVGLAVGVHNITLTVDDGFGGTSTAPTAVTVQDATAPLQARITALAAQNASLTALNRQLQQQLAASQQAIADAVRTIQTNLRASFRDPTFTIPGGTSQDQLQALVQAVVQLSKGCRQHVYGNLGGHNRDDDR
jgi:N-acetylneuraminic acid mutarotase